MLVSCEIDNEEIRSIPKNSKDTYALIYGDYEWTDILDIGTASFIKKRYFYWIKRIDNFLIKYGIKGKKDLWDFPKELENEIVFNPCWNYREPFRFEIIGYDENGEISSQMDKFGIEVKRNEELDSEDM